MHDRISAPAAGDAIDAKQEQRSAARCSSSTATAWIYEQAAPRVMDSSMRAHFRGIRIFNTAMPHLLRNVIQVNRQGVVIAGHAGPTLEQTTVSQHTIDGFVHSEAQTPCASTR